LYKIALAYWDVNRISFRISKKIMNIEGHNCRSSTGGIREGSYTFKAIFKGHAAPAQDHLLIHTRSGGCPLLQIILNTPAPS
jgi:hypothetical protein